MSLENNYVIGAGSDEVLHVLHPRLRYPHLWRGCIAAWAPCLGPSGSILRDNSGNRRNGVLTNMNPAADWVVSGSNYSVRLDGTNDYISMPSLPYGTSFTISIWAQPNAVATAQMLWTKKTSNVGDANQSVQLFFNTAELIARCFSGVGNYIGRATGSIATAEMQHIGFVYTGGATSSAIRIYRNGIRVDIADSAGGTFTTFNDASIRTTFGVQNIDSSPSNYFAGRIDDARVYNRVLSESEIASLASRRGIAYETRRRRYIWAAAAPATVSTFASRRPTLMNGRHALLGGRNNSLIGR